VGVVNIIVTTPGGVSQAGVTAQFTFVAIAPPAPTIGSAVAGNAQATVSFTAPVSNGGAAITSYTVTSIPGGITATGTASPITVSGLTNGTSYTFTVTATNSVGAGAASAATNSVTPVSPVPPVVLFTPASLPGVTNSASVVDVGQGLGKTVLACFMDTLRQSLGGNPQFLGQDAYGIVKIAVNGSMYPFYPMQASATDNRGAGIYLTGTNLLDGVSSCGTLSGAPALFDLAAFATAMTQAGWSLQIDAQGVIAAVSGNRAYVGRPAVVATAPGVPGLAFQNASGTFGTTAMTQGLLPAVLDPVALQNVISQLNGAMVVQADATVFVSFGNGKHFVLTPDFLLVAGAAGNTAPAYWQDGVNHYFYRIANGTYANYAQGVTLTPAP
jgi:hypothetical protein